MNDARTGTGQLSPPATLQLHGLMVALVAVLAAGLVRWLLTPYVGDRVPFATFFIAIVFAVRFGGFWPSVLAMLLGLGWALLSWFPKGMLDEETVVSSLLYVVSSLTIIALGRQMLRAEALAAGRTLQLQDTVQGLSLSQGRLQLATEVSGIGVFEWDVAGDRFTGENPEAYRVFGRHVDEPKLSMAEFIARHLHPDDVRHVQGRLQHAMQPGERFHVMFRNRRIESDDWRWVEVNGRFQFDTAGKPERLVGVIADISERKALEDNLRKMAADLSEADRRKDEFLATLAHELRNPLAPIRNGIELLKRGGNAAQTGNVVGVMERQMSHMVRLVDDLIDVSRITRNKLELRRSRVELAQVMRTAVEASRPLIESKGHLLSVELPATPVSLDADGTRLVQIFSNLLNNASKYTDRGGNIRVIARREGGDVLVSISDNGNGIPPRLLPRVFEMFIQLDGSPERSQGGLGIGLSMVKRLVELHGGSVAIDSRGEGEGTCVQVRLPVVLVPDLAPLPAPAPRGDSPRRRVLIADDNHDAADSLAKVIAMMGNDTFIAYDGQEAVDAALEHLPDVVMLDIGMPRMNGYEACRRIREHPANSGAVVIAITGWGQDEDRLRSQEAGFDLHLTKPVDPAAMESLLAALPPPRERAR